jgi:hypothetical protein
VKAVRSGVAAIAACLLVGLLAPGGAAAVGPGDETSTGVVCAPASPATGTPTTCTATVADLAASGATTPTGTVGFGAAPNTGQFGSSGSCTLAAATAADTSTCELAFMPSAGGSIQITGTYEGDGSHAGSLGSFALAVIDATSTVVTCTPSTLLLQDTSDCSATVADETGHEAMLGDIDFSAIPAADSSFGMPGTCSFRATSTTAATTCSIQFTPPTAGTYSVYATYYGDTDHAASQGSAPVTADAIPPGTVTTTGGETTGYGSTPPPGSVTIGGGKLVVARGGAGVKLTCVGRAGTSCAGRLTLSARAKVVVPPVPGVRRRKHARPVMRTVLLILGSSTYTLGVRRSATVRIKLSKTALALVAAARRHALKATATAGQVQQTAVARTVTLAGKATKKRKKHKR